MFQHLSINNLWVIFFSLWLLGVILWAISWPFRKKNSGSLLFKVKQNYLKRWGFWLGVFNSVTAVYITVLFFVKINTGFPSYTNLSLEIMQVSCMWTIGILLLASELNPPEFRENGICSGLTFVSWQSINSYHWLPSPRHILMFRFRRRLAWLPGMWMIEIPASYRDAVNEILSERVASK